MTKAGQPLPSCNDEQPIHSLTSPSTDQFVNDSLAGIAILAGGLSTRMGKPKALLKLPSGETLLEYHVRQASAFNVPIYIADNGQGFEIREVDYSLEAKPVQPVHILDYKPSDNTVDEVDQTSASYNTETMSKPKHSAGPLGAIMAGLLQARINQGDSPSVIPENDKWLMVISCDSLISAPDIWSQVEPNLCNLSKANTEASQIKMRTTSSKQVFCLSNTERLYPLLGLYNLSLTDRLKAYLDDGNRRVMGFINPICQPITMPVDWQPLSNLNTPEQFAKACQSLI